MLQTRALFQKEKSIFLDVFFGPVCDDYVLAPVARYASVWGVPIITPAGLARAFTCKQDYR